MTNYDRDFVEEEIDETKAVRKAEWQDVDYALSWFGQNTSTARKSYRRYLQDGMGEGHREDLVGGGLIQVP